jgi:succinoglycan biosynthesis protein ExoM
VPEIVVAIPTFRRPLSLSRLLIALGAQETEQTISILVGDNDDNAREGAELSRRMAGNFRWKIDTLIVAERGIAQARNALVACALQNPETQFVAMLDDDEWPEPQWLEALLRTQRTSGADIVRGPVLREFEIAPPLWVSDWDGIAPINHEAGHRSMFEGIGNVLISRHCFDAVGFPWFDPRFALTGGEDKDFLTRLQALDMRFALADDAIVYEHVPASRIRLGWSLQRAYRTGNTDMLLTLKNRHGAGDVAREIAKILAALISFPVLSIVYSTTPRHRLEGLRRVYRAAGKIGALFGHRYHEYSTHHGR